ncbi:MAG TPA: hypothetical protein LFW20_06445 [Rickettsia endosymbiont of Omalisus fontisbellaquei]|nr:hypothetical protein [Rickettsia endosymbiont of Omalisus fontisbellaquei]
MKSINLFTTIILVLALTGCAFKDQNRIDNDKINEVRRGNKAIILIQTTPIVFSNKFLTAAKRVELSWLNPINNSKPIVTKNYYSVYIPPDIFLYNYHNMEVYIVSPGKYSLSQVKYFKSDAIYYTLRPGRETASFSVNAGEVLYIGNLTINVRDNIDNIAFYSLKNAITIEDNYNIAVDFLNKNYPDLLTKLQKKLITLY